MLVVVPDTKINRELPCQRPMVLYKRSRAHRRKIYVRIAECLPELVRPSRYEIGESTEKIYAAESIAYSGSKRDTIDGCARLKQMLTPRQ